MLTVAVATSQDTAQGFYQAFSCTVIQQNQVPEPWEPQSWAQGPWCLHPGPEKQQSVYMKQALHTPRFHQRYPPAGRTCRGRALGPQSQLHHLSAV